jgi:hypothetical protein
MMMNTCPRLGRVDPAPVVWVAPDVVGVGAADVIAGAAPDVVVTRGAGSLADDVRLPEAEHADTAEDADTTATATASSDLRPAITT